MLVLAALRVALVAVAVASPSPSPAPAPTASASPAPAPAPSSIADFYTADRSKSATQSEFELRIRDDGHAWLVTAAATVAKGHFETGTWHAEGPGRLRVDLDTTATVDRGAPHDPQPETRSLSFAWTPCTLTLTGSTPPNALGETGIAFAKRHCP